MVKIISKFRDCYDYVFGQGDPAYVWTRRSETDLVAYKFVRSNHVILDLVIGRYCYRLFFEGDLVVTTGKKLLVNSLVTTTGKKRFFQTIDVERTYKQGPSIVVNNQNCPLYLTFTSTNHRSDRTLIINPEIGVLMGHLNTIYGLTPEIIAQQIEEWFSMNYADKPSPPVSDKAKIATHGFDIKTSFRGKQK